MAAVLAPEMRPWDATMTEQLQVGLERATDTGGERLELGACANYRRAALGNEEAVVFHGRCFPEHHKAIEEIASAFSIP